MTDQYHHGNLKNALVETGIQVIAKEGESALSLRRVAKECNVSQAAPYAHFKNKEELIAAMQEHVTRQFMEVLQESIVGQDEITDGTIIDFGVAYIHFFVEHPYYFQFLYGSPYFKIHLTIEEREDAYPPFALFQKVALKFLRANDFAEDSLLCCLTNMWGTVQGITMLATSKSVVYEGDLRKDLRRILTHQ